MSLSINLKTNVTVHSKWNMMKFDDVGQLLILHFLVSMLQIYHIINCMSNDRCHFRKCQRKTLFSDQINLIYTYRRNCYN